MSSPTNGSTTDTPARVHPQATGGLGGRLRRHRSTLVVAASFAAAVAVVVVTSGGASSTGTLDPDNPAPDGARAVTRVLDDEGVQVDVARGIEALEAVPVSARSTVLVTSTDYLGGEITDRLLSHAGGARVVLVAPTTGVLESLGLGLTSTYTTSDTGWRGDCADPLYDDLRLLVDRTVAYRAGGPADDAEEEAGPGCFGTDAGSVLVESGGVTVFGAADALSNEQVTLGDDAAVVLRLLGQGEQLVWYVPRYEDLPAGDGVSAQALLPRWVRPGLWLGALTLAALVLWRARRLGPLSTEPLPVVVKAIETTLSRGRLYRRAGDRSHAARSLRDATRARAATRLQLGARVEEAALVRDVARHTGRPVVDVEALIGSRAAPPGSDLQLIHLASALAALEEEVRRP